MTERSSTRLARGLAGIGTASALFGLGYAFASWRAPLPSQAFGFRRFPALLAIEFAVTGLILATKRPRNPGDGP